MLRTCLFAALCIALPALAANDWAEPHQPFRIYGNTYYVGTKGVSAVLITSKQGHILLDAATAEAVPVILANIRGLGFKPEQIKLIVNSHAHHDHAGGIAAIQKLSGAKVGASSSGAEDMEHGKSSAQDPQAQMAEAYPAVAKVQVLKDGQILHIGPLAIRAHSTIGHTPGGMSYSWHACDNGKCKRLIYADSLTLYSDDNYRYSDHPAMIEGFQQGIKTLTALPCDILISTHPSASDVFERLAKREAGDKDAFINPAHCRSYINGGLANLSERLAKEKAKP